jgi:hypothetical protein
MQFDVTVQRIEHREHKHTFRVEADDRDAAFHAGLTAACDYDFHDSPIDSAEENVTAIWPVQRNANCKHCGEPIRVGNDGCWVHEDPDEDPTAFDYGWSRCLPNSEDDFENYAEPNVAKQ